MSEMTHNERMANVGETIELKGLGTVTVRELSLEDTMRAGKELMTVAATLDFGSQGKDGDEGREDEAAGGYDIFVQVLENPDLIKAFRVIAGCSTGRDATDFEAMGITDWLRLMNVMKKVHDFEELRDLFTKLIPGAAGLMSRLIERDRETSPIPSGSSPGTGYSQGQSSD